MTSIQSHCHSLTLNLLICFINVQCLITQWLMWHTFKLCWFCCYMLQPFIEQQFKLLYFFFLPHVVWDCLHTGFPVNASVLHSLSLHQIYEKRLYGPIYRDGLKSVSVNTPKLLEEIMRINDKFPSRGDMSMWKEYRDMRGFGYGPFTE